MIKLKIQIKSGEVIHETLNGKFSANNIIPAWVHETCERIVEKGQMDNQNRIFYPGHMIKKIIITEHL